MAKLDQHCDHVMVHTGQSFDHELSQVFFDELGIRAPDVFLGAAGVNAAEAIANVILRVDVALEEHQPDAMLVLGDTNSCLAVIAAKRRKVPIFHMEAGNRCFDFRVPEEINRRIVDHVSDINLTYSEIAREHLLREGLPPDHIIKTGSPMREILEYYAEGIESSGALADLRLDPGRYFLVSTHREENVDSPEKLRKILAILNALAESRGDPVIVSTHPRTRKRMDALEHPMHERVRFMKPFGFLDYVKLQQSATCVLSDSGTITEESSILNFPALNLREVHERPEGFEEASVMMVGLSVERVFQALGILESQSRGSARTLRLVSDYAPANVSEKVVRIILSYTDFVNRKVWHKSTPV